MGALAKGDIVLFPFPFTDLSSRKIRPCLVLSDEMQDDILLCQITSQQSRKDAFVIELGKRDTLDGSLSIDSFIRTNMLFTADKRQIIRKICRLKRETYLQVIQRIAKTMAPKLT